MKTFRVADPQVQDIIAQVSRKWHASFATAEVSILAIFTESDDESPAIVKSGFPVLAQISVVREKDRATKNHDAEILIDAIAWGKLNERQRLAVIDHELSHLKVRTKKGAIQRDCFGRPKLGTVKGDWNIGDGFRVIVERHGEAAVELLNICRAHAMVQKIIAGDGGSDNDVSNGESADAG